MAAARYVIRLDDACPTMNQARWSRIEAILDRHGVKPVVAVVPDNHDPDLVHDAPDPLFWDRARAWQAKGWVIAMHGLSHTLRETMARQLLPFHKRSEFSGLAYAEQAEKLANAKARFLKQGMDPHVWIAPAHGFDEATLKALRDITGIRIISDGIAFRPFHKGGFNWVPQQLWRFRLAPPGLWTVCIHPNNMDDAALDAFANDIATHAARIIAFHDIPFSNRRRDIWDRALNAAYWLRRGRFYAALR